MLRKKAMTLKKKKSMKTKYNSHKLENIHNKKQLMINLIIYYIINID